MAHTFKELVVGGVLFAPFVGYVAAAMIIILFLRPALRLFGFEKMFSNGPIAELSLYVMVVALLIYLI